jgi:hypothetical protein
MSIFGNGQRLTQTDKNILLHRIILQGIWFKMTILNYRNKIFSHKYHACEHYKI